MTCSPCRIDTGLAPGRKRAYLLYKAAMNEAAAAAAAQSKDSPDSVSSAVVAAPHPYTLALGVLSIQKVSCIDCYSGT